MREKKKRRVKMERMVSKKKGVMRDRRVKKLETGKKVEKNDGRE